MPDEQQLEEEHVRQVYEGIAHHFSSTRYRPWPVVATFVQRLAPFSLGLDAGCGNGKNMLIRRHDLHCTGLDLSWELLTICREAHNLPVVYGNMLRLPLRTSSHDYVICIAALHHLASRERRLRAVCEMGRVLRPGGLVLIFVWALEQSTEAGSSLHRHQLKYLEADNPQDVLVPWKTSDKNATAGGKNITTNNPTTTKTTTAQDQSSPEEQPLQHNNGSQTSFEVSYRFYHLFREGELEQLLLDSGQFAIDYAGYDRDNWYCCARRL